MKTRFSNIDTSQVHTMQEHTSRTYAKGMEAAGQLLNNQTNSGSRKMKHVGTRKCMKAKDNQTNPGFQDAPKQRIQSEADRHSWEHR